MSWKSVLGRVREYRWRPQVERATGITKETQPTLIGIPIAFNPVVPPPPQLLFILCWHVLV